MKRISILLFSFFIFFSTLAIAEGSYDLTNFYNISANAGNVSILKFEVNATGNPSTLSNITINYTGFSLLDIVNVAVYNDSGSLFGQNSTFNGNIIIISGNEPIDGIENFTVEVTLNSTPTHGNIVDVKIEEIGGTNVLNTSILPYDPLGYLTIDVVKPSFEIGITQPFLSNYNWTNATQLILYFNVMDNGSGVNQSTINVTASGGNIIFNPLTDCNGFKFKYVCNATWNITNVEGSFIINITANDTIDIGSDNQNISAGWSINVDHTPPIITLISPGNNTWTNYSRPQFIFNATDNMANNFYCELRVFNNGNPFTVYENNSIMNFTTTIAQNDTQFPDTVWGPPSYNIYTWFIVCQDLAQNINNTMTMAPYWLFVDNTTPKFVGSKFLIRDNPTNISVYDPVILSVEFNETNVAYVGLDIIDLNESGNKGVVKIYKKPVTLFMGDPMQEIKEYWTNWDSKVFVLTNGTHNTTNITVEMNEYENGFYLISGWLNESKNVYAYFNISSLQLISINATDGSFGYFASQIAGNFTSMFMNASYTYINDTIILTNLSNLRLIEVFGNESHIYAANAYIENYAQNSNSTYPDLQILPLRIVTTPSTGTFVSGKIYDLDTGQLITQNATIVATEFKAGGGPLQALKGLTWSVLKTTSNGIFSLSLNRTGRSEWEYNLQAYMKNASGIKIKTSPIIPPLPALMNMTNLTLYLVNATTITIRGVNASGQPISGISGMIMSSGIPLSFFSNISANGINITVPRGRNYTITWWVEPENVNVTEIFPCPPQSTIIPAENVTQQFNANISCNIIHVNGTILNSTPVNFTSLKTYIKIGEFIPWDSQLGWYTFEGPAPPGMTNDTLNTSTGFYDKQIISGSINYILVAYATNGSHWFVGFTNVTNPQSNLTVNISLYPATHNSTIGWNATRFYFIANVSGYVDYVNNVHTEFYLKGYPNVSSMKWIFDSRESSYVDVPLIAPQDCSSCKVEMMIFSQRFAPLKKTIKANELLNQSINITLREFMMKPPEENETLPFILEFLKTGGDCNHPNPPTNCLISHLNVSEGKFDPLKAAMQGNVNIRLELNSGVTLQFINVDLISSGPPDAELSPEAISDLSSGTSFGRIWKLGSMAPHIYDYALIGIPYNDSVLNENKDIRIHIPYLYDEDWNIIWNATDSNNGTNYTKLVNAYPEYNESEGWDPAYFNGTGVLCQDGTYNSSMFCWIDKTNNMIWFRIPHFSGIAPQENGTKWLQLDEVCTSDSQCLSGNCLYGLCKPANWECYSNAHCPSGYYCNSNHVCRQLAFVSVAPSRIRSWTEMTAGVPHIFRLIEKEIGITQINVTIKNPAQNVEITVKKLEEKPAEVTEVKGKVYQYLEILAQNLEEENIEKAFIRFNVTKSWITENNLSKYRVFLYRFSENEWKRLPTQLIEENDYYVYEAQTPGFSYFAIVGEKLVCEEEVKKCVGNDLYKCINNSWQVIESCEYGCNETSLECNPKPPAGIICYEGTKKCVGNELQICQNNTWKVLEVCEYGCNKTLLECNPKPVQPIDYTLYIIIGIIGIAILIILKKFAF